MRDNPILGAIERAQLAALLPQATLDALSVTHEHITARKQVEQALQASETRYRRLFESAKDGILILDAESGQIEDVNPFLIALLGYPHEDFVGKHLWEIGAFKDIAASKEAFLDLQAKGYVRYEDLPLETRDGRQIAVEFVSNVYPENANRVIQCNIRDITERKRVAEALQAITTHQEVILATVPSIIMEVDSHRLYTWANRTGLDFFGDDVIGKDATSFFEGEQETQKLVQQLFDGDEQVVYLESWQHRRDGENRLLSWWCHVLKDHHGHVTGALSTAQDITEQKQADAEHKELQAQLLQAQKLESIGTLAGGVAHEINNPIMGIMNYAQLIVDELGPDSPITDYAAEIGKETDRVATIVRNLLSFARMDKETHKSPARLCDIVDDTLSLVSAVMRHDQITLEVSVPAELPKILCRNQQIRQVLMNLLTNARDAVNQKYPTRDANKKIVISAREHPSVSRDRLSAFASDAKAGKPETRKQSAPDTGHRLPVADHASFSRWLRLTVEDHGPGIPEALRARILDPFFSTKSPDKGTGLGLSISHSIVKEHGGKLSIESEVGQWTQFHVDLPLAPVDLPLPQSPSAGLPIMDGAP